MITPFENDIFALIWKAFKNLYPDKKCKCFWEPQIREDESGNEVFVRPDLNVSDAGEILAHELAHVAVGVAHEHDEAWENAFEAIFQEYNKIGNALFENQ